MNDNIQFDIPGHHLKAEFMKYKNNNWKFIIIDTENNINKMVSKSVSAKIMVKIIEDLTQSNNDPKNHCFKKSYQSLKEKVETMKENININKICTMTSQSNKRSMASPKLKQTTKKKLSKKSSKKTKK